MNELKEKLKTQQEQQAAAKAEAEDKIRAAVESHK